MTTIWKFPLVITDHQQIAMPRGQRVLYAGPDPIRRICLWAQVNTDEPTELVDVWMVGTGNPMPDEPTRYVGTVNQGPFVWHVFVRA